MIFHGAPLPVRPSAGPETWGGATVARRCCPLPVTLHHGVLGSAKRPAGLDRLLCHAAGVTQRREWLPFPMFPCASRVSARRGGGVGSRGHCPTPSVASTPDPVPAGTRSGDIPSAISLGDRVLLCAAFFRFHAVLGEMARSRDCNWRKVRDSVLGFLFCFLFIFHDQWKLFPKG